MAGDTIIYPYCYATQEILDNGPLRFTVKLVYNPLVVKEILLLSRHGSLHWMQVHIAIKQLSLIRT